MESATSSRAYPLVSIIIPCYNYGHFLAEAIESAANQTYPAKEILVIDDGSTDNTSEIAAHYPAVKYVYQPNQGLSAARNTGIQHSQGTYLVFLDADDWLFPEALASNVRHLQQHPQAAFVVGAHTRFYSDGQPAKAEGAVLPAHPYQALLSRGNYIAMIAAVMFTRWALAEFEYDPSLLNCEDYDLYLNITRHHPIVQHSQQLAAYRIHAAAMSASAQPMLAGALKVLGRQREHLRGPAELEAYYRGIHFWHTYYTGGKEFKFLPGSLPLFSPALALFLKAAPYTALRYSLGYALPRLLKQPKAMLKKLLKKLLPTAGKRWLHYQGRLGDWTPAVGQVALGDFWRLAPLSNEFGYDRGGPIDRYYIENFLLKEAASIRGRVLEIGDNAYTLQYGGPAVSQSDVLHVDATNPQATLVGDLSAAPHIPDNTFDCLVLTQTLHLIYDFKSALQTCYRILKPGGTLLLTVPGLTPIDRGEWKKTWYWTFTDTALERLLAETFPAGDVEISSFGNVRVATAYLYGLGLPEIDRASLAYYDPQFQVINAVKAVKHAPLD
ncbi:glycosyltransferase [Hymenobacter sp. RP-2-7]|uniref:Glycosyltransferase n=1 Tax=Hymenobacter polaris TaxID=2682546 RepID=A0A7Y0AGW2_9BACT|nr:glycosyltransferase [Hymenobacter polaris]NML67128.1 glycosyltransferase [Hymenobacter polaris]